MGQLVGIRVPLEIHQLHGIAWRLQYIHHVTSGNAVTLAETLQDIDTLWGKLEEGALEREDQKLPAVDGFNEARIDKSLADGSGHFLGHRECSGGSSRNYAGWVLGIGHAVGLGEFERAQVVDGLFRGECVVISSETNAVRIQLQADHQCGEQVHEILR